MNKFWQNYFLMNEAGSDGGEGGSGGGEAPASQNAETGGEAPASQPNNAPNFDTGLFNDKPEDGEQVPDDKPNDKPEDGEKYDPETAYSEFKYELPEGYTLTEDQQKQYIDMAKEKGVKPDQLQTFVNEHIEAEKGKIEQYKGIVKGWESEVMSDPVIGGDNFPETRKNVNTACSIEGGKEFREVLASTGLISNPAVVRYLNKLGTMVNSDGLVTGKQSQNDSASQSIKSLYNKSNY